MVILGRMARAEKLYNATVGERSMIEVREAREEDRESAVRLMWKAFEATANLDEVMKQDWTNRWNRPEDGDWAYVAVENGRVVANLSFFKTAANEQIIRHRPVSFAGVWAVATDPAYRRTGLIRRLFEASFPRMKEEGVSLSILDPFYRPFYEKFGYALAEKRMKHNLKRDQLRVGPKRNDISVREATKEDYAILHDIERSMSRFGSRFFANPQTFDYLAKNGHLHILQDSAGPVGTVWFQFAKGEGGYDISASCTRYKSDDVFPTIVELVRNYAVNSSKLTWWTDADVPVRHYLSDIHASQSQVIGSMMMRVVDLEGYCSSIAVPESTSDPVTIELHDDQCPWNNGIFKLEPDGGRLDAQKTHDAPDVKLTALQLSEIVGGLNPPTLLRSLRAMDCDRDTAQKLEAIFPSDNFVSYVRF